MHAGSGRWGAPGARHRRRDLRARIVAEMPQEPAATRNRVSCRPCRRSPFIRAWSATGPRRTGNVRHCGWTGHRAPARRRPRLRSGWDWRVIVRNDDHNTFDHVAFTLARYVPGMTVDRGYAIAERIHTRAWPWCGRAPGAGRAVLGAAARRGPDDGPARAGGERPFRIVLGPLLPQRRHGHATIWVEPTEACEVTEVPGLLGAHVRGRGPSLRAARGDRSPAGGQHAL